MTVAAVDSAPTGSRHGWAGRLVTGLPVVFLTWDSAIKLLDLPPVAESFARLGYPPGVGPAIGLLELACLALYLLPRTAPLGALLLTGFLGGAVATHVRVGDPLLTHALFPVYVGALAWAGLWLRERRLRSLLPLRVSALEAFDGTPVIDLELPLAGEAER